MPARLTLLAIFVGPFLAVALGSVCSGEIELDQRPAEPGEWGYRPSDDDTSAVNPPSFSWRPQRQITSWEIECRSAADSSTFVYTAIIRDGLNVHCPPTPFAAGTYTWRYRGTQRDGEKTPWSQSRRFTIPADAAQLAMPPREELLARIPQQHPRLFVRPEQLPRLRELARGAMQPQFQDLVRQCDGLLKSPPPTEEPPKYPPGTVRNSDPWRKIWWGNRTYTIGALDGAATLGFAHLLGGKEEYGQLAKRILMDCAAWDPKGATGYRYNDEAGMPYNYYFVRTYTFIYDLLDKEQRETCRRVMKIRGDEMYRHLCPNHLWRPYSSHSNRAWHFLGEIGIAMQDEVEGADDWVWFAMNVFYNTYPVWSDSDGGWHEGFSYWRSYIERFTWWADVMRTAMNVNAYDKPYFSKIGYYPMYLLPPGKVGGGFGDLNARSTSASARGLVGQLAAQAGNGHWQWYVDQLGGSQDQGGYIGFVRGAQPVVDPQSPAGLPSSRLFSGIGQAILNTTIEDAKQDVQVVFKSSPFGTASHGYEANNSFLLWAYGQRLLIRSGFRDSYGSEHHQKWMWSTRSVNNITVNGEGQLRRSQASQGRIVAFRSSPTLDYVVGEAAEAYRDKTGPQLDRFTRSILFVKPDLIVVFDRLVARQPSTFEYWLHATNKFDTEKFDVQGQRQLQLSVKDVRCNIELLAPATLELSQTDQYDPNPRPRITLREWHLTAKTPQPIGQIEFVAVLRPFRQGDSQPPATQLESLKDQYRLTANVADAAVTIQLPLATAGPEAKTVIVRHGEGGQVLETVTVE